jgi:hypothetical protein
MKVALGAGLIGALLMFVLSEYLLGAGCIACAFLFAFESRRLRRRFAKPF